VDSLRKSIQSLKPQTHLDKVDHDRISAHRVDIVDEQGTIRLTLAAPTPAPIIGGTQYKRAFPVSGLTYFDQQGNERGGLGVADVPGGAVVVASDHENVDAIGWRVMPDGSVMLRINQKPPVEREPTLNNRVRPATAASSRILLDVKADGTPTIAVADRNSQARVRLTVTDEGYGAIEFLDAKGKVVETLAPEAHKHPR
jgi:hypothetical protein